jgi:hypothetical protein
LLLLLLLLLVLRNNQIADFAGAVPSTIFAFRHHSDCNKQCEEKTSSSGIVFIKTSAEFVYQQKDKLSLRQSNQESFFC